MYFINPFETPQCLSIKTKKKYVVLYKWMFKVQALKKSGICEQFKHKLQISNTEM